MSLPSKKKYQSPSCTQLNTTDLTIDEIAQKYEKSLETKETETKVNTNNTPKKDLTNPTKTLAGLIIDILDGEITETKLNEVGKTMEKLSKINSQLNHSECYDATTFFDFLQKGKISQKTIKHLYKCKLCFSHFILFALTEVLEDDAIDLWPVIKKQIGLD